MTKTKTFDELWRDLEERSRRWAIPIVQDYKELEYVFNLIKGCGSYLEIGTAEGNGLYVLSHAIKLGGKISIIDFGEKHTAAARQEVCDILTEGHNKLIYKGDEPSYDKEMAKPPHYPHVLLGNSHSVEIRKWTLGMYDVVFIDAGHTYEDVIADAIAYGQLATKYIIFHDICLPPVKTAVEWYLKQNPQFKYHEFINSETYGYGIIEV
jgi:hypothetical protein